jgi:hypothetical protein
MHINRTVADDHFGAPYPLQDLIAKKDAAGLGGKQR